MNNISTRVKRNLQLPILVAGLILGGSFLRGVRAQVPGLPRPDHIVILIEENENDSSVICDICSVWAPWFNQLAHDTNTALFNDMQAITHPSQPNYLDFYAGYNPGPSGTADGDDSVTGWPFSSPNLGQQLLAAGLGFKTYSQDLPSVGFEGQYSATGSYARKHNPVTNWQGSGYDQVPDSLNQPFTDWPDSLHFDLLPTISYVVPDEDSDMHNGTGLTPITIGDYWAHTYLSSYLRWALTHNSLFIMTFDESGGSDYENGILVNHIPTIFYGPMVQGGEYNQAASLFSMLRTFEDMYALKQYGGYCGTAADSTPITYCWKAITGISSPGQTMSGLQVYPNPSNSIITFDGKRLNQFSYDLAITDITGREMARYELQPSFNLNLNTTDYAAGVYFYRLKQANGQLETGKFVVVH